ncbi:TetR/AcrR family transcriptional regulator [Sporosarcina sp. FA9]|uniref:TetR/AcrR family transcriptional regulator n=1 Tax=Sporosarcina sp. FA9 TaxID=3413030 RepID=UPI003F6577BE
MTIRSFKRGVVDIDSNIRWDKERLDGKSKRKIKITESAEKVFSIKGFEKTTMQEIADEEGIGIATLFRYFPKKDMLIVAVAVNILGRYFHAFQTIAQLNVSSLEKIERLFDYFTSQLNPENLGYTQLIEAFESYAALQFVPLDDMAKYNDAHREISDVFSIIIEEGKRDGSIRGDIPTGDVLTSIINAFSLFSRKLSLFENIPHLEADVVPSNQLAIVKSIFIDYLKVR